jgi:GTP-binding protein HflX
VSLVGYTSAGKSTLFKTLTGEDVPVSQQLFSTLDPILRRVETREIEEGYYFLLSDTVGFIREMPRELFKAFKATLEEVVQSDLVLHIVDIAIPDYLERKREVQKILDNLNIPAEKIIDVYNKIDLLENGGDYVNGPDFPRKAGNNEIFISAKENKGILELKKAIFEKYFKDYERFEIIIPAGIIRPDAVKRWAIVMRQHVNDGLMNLQVLCSRENMVKFKEKYGGYLR